MQLQHEVDHFAMQVHVLPCRCFQFILKMKDLSATFHLPGTNILLRGLFLSVNQIARIC